jgi:hypothetical protein
VAAFLYWGVSLLPKNSRLEAAPTDLLMIIINSSSGSSFQPRWNKINLELGIFIFA